MFFHLIVFFVPWWHINTDTMRLVHSLNKRRFYNTQSFPSRKLVLLPPSKLLITKKKSICSVLFLSMLDDSVAVDDV